MGGEMPAHASPNPVPRQQNSDGESTRRSRVGDPSQYVAPVNRAAYVLGLQGSAGNRATTLLVSRHAVQRDRAGAGRPGSDDANRFLVHYFVGQGHQRRRDIDGIAAGLKERVRGQQYGLVRAVVQEVEARIEDNVVSTLMNLLLDVDLGRAAESGDGRAMLDVMYDALVTGDVSSAERKSSTRILDAKRKQVPQDTFLSGMDRRMIFPIRNIGMTRTASATFRAELLPNGKVKVRYTSIKVDQYQMFADDLKTLGGWSAVREGLVLEPEHIVAVRLHDEGLTTPVDIPALALIDYGQQIQDKTLSTAATAFFLGLTVGLGALGGGAIRGAQTQIAKGKASKAALWGARGLVWAERAAFGIQAGALFINDRRDWILKNWPDGGRTLLDAVDTANRIAGFYGAWGRLSIESIIALRTKALAASQAWKSSTAQPRALKPQERQTVKAIDDEIDLLAAELLHAQQLAARHPAPAPRGRAGFGDSPRVVEARRPPRIDTADAYEHIKRDSGGFVKLKRDGHAIVCQRCAETPSWSAGIEKDYRKELRDHAAAPYRTRLADLKLRETATPASEAAAREMLAREFGALVDDLDAFRIRARIMERSHLDPQQVDALIRLSGGQPDVVEGLLHLARYDHRRVRALLTWSSANGSPARRIWELAKKFEKRTAAPKTPFSSTRLGPYATEANISHFLEAHHYRYFEPDAIAGRPPITTMWSPKVTVQDLENHLLEAVDKLKARPWHPRPNEMSTTVKLDNGVVVQLGVHHNGYIGQFYPVSGPADLVEQVAWDELVEAFGVLFGQAAR
ncbi:hypothetical protein ACFPQB_18275 [Nocardioides vastitatis]|uniref:DUF4781 domain-containing protein n=1 Tax=Nocardioides vastitatis TaxID=2568655 RepID=A0ABW0ZIT2_9ACTN